MDEKKQVRSGSQYHEIDPVSVVDFPTERTRDETGQGKDDIHHGRSLVRRARSTMEWTERATVEVFVVLLGVIRMFGNPWKITRRSLPRFCLTTCKSRGAPSQDGLGAIKRNLPSKPSGTGKEDKTTTSSLMRVMLHEAIPPASVVFLKQLHSMNTHGRAIEGISILISNTLTYRPSRLKGNQQNSTSMPVSRHRHLCTSRKSPQQKTL